MLTIIRVFPVTKLNGPQRCALGTGHHQQVVLTQSQGSHNEVIISLEPTRSLTIPAARGHQAEK